MAPKDEYLIVRQFEDCIAITGINIDLRQSSIPGGKSLIVQGFDIVLPDTVQLAGHSISILAHRLSSPSEHAALITSGADGDSVVLKARDGVQPGENGQAGVDGGKGQSAGDINIWARTISVSLRCEATGGSGGNGQTGGSGAQGPLGSPGKDDDDWEGHVGGRGGTGGAGGDAARGGNGGDGGDNGLITVAAIQSAATVTASSVPGNGGKGGQSGSPGHGGPGGYGGAIKIGEEDEHHIQYFYRGDRYPNGPEGRFGNPVPGGRESTQGHVGRLRLFDGSGEQSALRQVVGQDTLPLLRPSLEYVRVLLLGAELDYRNERTSEAREKLEWVIRVTRAINVPFRQGSVNDIDSSGQDNWVSLRERAICLAHQLSAGVTFYGYPPHFVQLVAAQVYESLTDDLLAIGLELQTATDQLDALKDSDEQLESAITKAIINSSRQRTALARSADALVSETGAIERHLDLLLTDLNVSEMALYRAQDAFKLALQRQTGGKCGFEVIIKIVKTIAAVYSGGSSIVAGAGGVLGSTDRPPTDSDGWKELAAKFKYLQEQITQIAGGLEEIQKAYEDLKTLVDTKPDAVTIVADQEEFEKTIGPFLHMPEARELQSLMRHLVIQLTQVTPICSVSARGRLSAGSGRVRRALWRRGGVPGVLGPAAMARRLSMSPMRPPEGLAGSRAPVAVRHVWAADLGDGWHDLPGHADAAADVVSRDVVRHQPEDGDERPDPATRPGPRELPDRVDVAAQVAAGHGATGTRAVGGPCRSRRDLHRRARARGPRSRRSQENVDCYCGGGGWSRRRPHSAASRSERLRRLVASVHRRRDRDGGVRPYRRLAWVRAPEGTWLSASHHVSQRPRARCRPVAACPLGGVAPQAMAARHASGRREPGPSRLLPRRVHVSIQPSSRASSRQAVLPACAASRGRRSGAVPAAGQRGSPPTAAAPPAIARPQLIGVT
jgi:hypothetical protein